METNVTILLANVHVII